MEPSVGRDVAALPPLRVLYISYTGLLDPLGQGQVLQYVLALARVHHMTLLTFEKPERLEAEDDVGDLEARCRSAGIDWHRLVYHRRPGIPATLYDMAAGMRLGLRLARQADVQIVHARSYVAGIMALAVKRATGARFLFDMRGFWPDERADSGLWSRNSMRYRVMKRIEGRLLRSADHVVSLTHSGAEALRAFEDIRGRMPPVSVIPTCTNLDLFRPGPSKRGQNAGFVLGYVGSAGSWYMFDDVARAVRLLFAVRGDARFKIVNAGEHDAIRAKLRAAGVDLARVDLMAVPFARVAAEIQDMDAGIFFIQPYWSKRASCPTRMGEFLGCGKPCLANAGVGDVADLLDGTGTGIVVDRFDDATLGEALSRLIILADAPDISDRCRAAAETHCSLSDGVESYKRAYRGLSA